MSKRKTSEEFIKEAKLIHGNKYDYSLVNYINGYTKIKIICPIHSVIEQTPCDHLRSCGCSKCGNKKITNIDFLIKAKIVYGDRYSYLNENFDVNLPA